MNKVYKKIIQDSEVGYAYHKVICDSNGIPYDYKCIEANKAFEKYTGLKAQDLMGEKINRILPDIVEKELDLIKYYEKITINGEKEEYEKYLKTTNRWCKIHFFSPEKYHFVTMCIDITEAKNNLLNKVEESKRMLWQVIDSIPSRIFWKDKDFKYLGCNKMFAEEAGYSIEEIIGKDDYEIKWQGLPLPDSYREDDKYVIETGRPKLNLEEEIIMPNGAKRWIRINKVPLYENSNNIYGLLVSFDDITKEKEIEKELKNNRFRHEQVARISRSVVWEVDKDGLYTYVSPVAEEVFGYKPDELIGKKYIYETIEEGQEENFKELIIPIIKQEKNLSGFENKFKTKNNEEVWVSTNGFPVLDDKEDFLFYRGISIDVSHFKKTEEDIRFLSFRDQLTGLYNRRFFEEELGRLDTERNLPLSLIIIDVDGLKLVNDAFGHRTGDLLLKKIASTIREQCRADDIVSRIGGDEFVILLPNTSLEEAETLMNRINIEIKKEKVEAINISISYGCNTKISAHENIEDILKKADIKMYNYKYSKNGKFRKKTIGTILERLFEKSYEEKAHSKGVSELSVAIGKALNLNELEIEKLKSIGKFHDIGKIVISKDILIKKDELTKEEWEEVKRHAELGYIILSSSDEYTAFAKDVLHHHERYDGKGYPRGLKGGEIPLNSRIISLAAAYDTMISGRPYQKAISRDKAMDIILKESGRQFDPKIVEAFLKSNIT